MFESNQSNAGINLVVDPQQASAAAETTVAIFKEKSVDQKPRREIPAVEYKKREPKPYSGFMVTKKAPPAPLALTASASTADAKPPKPVDMDRIAKLSKPA